MKSNLPCGAVLLLLFSYACSSVRPSYQNSPTPSSAILLSSTPDEISYSVFLSGGVSLQHISGVLTSIEANNTSKPSALILLGDVFSGDDISELDSDKNTYVASTIARLDGAFKEFYIVPGEKEWSSGKKTAHTNIQYLDKTLKDVKKEGRLIEPRKGCGELEVIELTSHAVLVMMDSQWAIESGSRKGEQQPGCSMGSVFDLRQEIKTIIQSYAGRHIIFAMHHPVYAVGPTAGNYPLSSHLLPLPVLGTIITGIKSLVASDQHFGHPAYEAFRTAFQTAIDGCKNCTVISGHEKSLQYFEEEGKHFLVAGSGEDITHARRGVEADFSFMSKGFVRADILTSGGINYFFYAVDGNGASTVVWSLSLPSPVAAPSLQDDVNNNIIVSGDSIRVRASDKYEIKNFLRGDFYRAAWSKEIDIPILRLDDYDGGLKPVQLGGGNQTRSMRLENKDGKQYVLRSIDKKVTAVLPPELRGTFAENVVQDGIAASHPYAALVVPRLAKAAGVFYTKPSVVYVPHQQALGIYDSDIGGGIYLFEDRPGGNTSTIDNFGNTKETYSTLDVIDQVAESHKHKVDQRAALRARLFDLWLGDWDRHDDQFRWASFKENGITTYKPIPRDRDQIFFNNNGTLDYIASRPYFSPALRRFDDEIDFLPGLMWAGKYFDRTFLHSLAREDFISMARELQSSLTDNVIQVAFTDWPREIDVLEGSRIRNSLQVRRGDLVEYAEEFYEYLSREVTVPASNDPDRITITAINNDELLVTVNRWSDDISYPFYKRIVQDDETKELRIFGLDKRDTIHITGEGNSKMKIRVVGGGGEDELINDSRHLQVIAYDDEDGMILSGKNISAHLNDKPFNNSYDRTDWKLNKTIHFPLPAYYTDEGFGFTYNLWSTRYGFRSDPFQSNHTVALSYFFNTGAFIGHYNGLWPHALGEFDFGFDAYFTGPTFTQYFYGLGNTYINYGEKSKYHIVKGTQIRLAPSIEKHFGFGSTLYLRPQYQLLNLEDGHEDPRFVYTQDSGLGPDDFGQRQYLGIRAGYSFVRLDNPGFPTRGGEVGVSVGGRTSLVETDISHSLLSAEGSLYIPFNVTGSVVLATHIQADQIIGDYEFFHALALGGADKLRGFKQDRFGGDARFLHATDLRFRVFQSRGMIPFSLGVYGSVDYGRVWYDGDDADDDTWHTSFGGGIYLVPLGLTAFRLGYMVGEDDRQINLGGALRF